MDNRKIGVFDSGIGGLTVVRALNDLLPKESLVYFGDTLNTPYGNRPKAEITAFSMRITKFLTDKNVKAILVACNTVSSMGIEKLRAAFDLPIIDVLSPGAAEAAGTAIKGVGVIATRNTIASGAHARIIKAHNPRLEVRAIACPLFVPIVEEGVYDTEIAAAAAAHYLSGLDESAYDLLLLGCTHYPVLEKAISGVTALPLMDPAAAAARAMKKQLEANDALTAEPPDHEFFTSGDPDAFDALAYNAFGVTARCRRALV